MAVPKKRQSKMKTRQRKANVRAPPPNAHSPRTHTRNLSCAGLFSRGSVCSGSPRLGVRLRLLSNRAKSVGYDPLEDPKYSFDEPDDEEDEDDDDEEDEEE